MIKLPLIMGLAIALTGCSYHNAVDRQGTYVDLYPVEYAMGFDLKNVSQKSAAAQLDAFIDEYWAFVITQPVELLASTPRGLVLAKKTKTALLKKGIEPASISLLHEPSVSQYDFKMSIIKHSVDTPQCEYSTLRAYDHGSTGCFVESARWSSMVRPERMLPKNFGNTVSE
ncbi:hypothetical protein ACWU4D_13050 [Vibrio sp. WJH972]